MALKAVLAEQITALVDAGFTQFLSGMAEATDTWSALSVLAMREKNPTIKLHCILPCKEQADKWGLLKKQKATIKIRGYEIQEMKRGKKVE